MAQQGLSPLAEQIKQSSVALFAAVAGELDNGVSRISPHAARLLKLHGVFQQDDRDLYPRGESDRNDRHYQFMIRVRAAGGRLNAAQMLGMLDLCETHGDGALRITARQGLELHGIEKKQLRPLLSSIARLGLTTLASGGDVNCNVMCCPAPVQDACHRQMQALAEEISYRFMPDAIGYRQLWLEPGVEQNVAKQNRGANHSAVLDDSFYGPTFLPHKFKIGLARPEDNCTDVLAQDVGLLAICPENHVTGYEVFAGGGMGTILSAPGSFPAIAQPLAFVPADHILAVLQAILAVYRDHGNRLQRSRARMKYLIHDWGMPRFREMVQRYAGFPLAPPRGLSITGHDDHLGWRPQGDGRWYLGLAVPEACLCDAEPIHFKQALRQVLSRYGLRVHLTSHHHVLLCDIPAPARDEIATLLAEHGVDSATPSVLRRHAIACPAMPYCPYSITESSRALPALLGALEVALRRLGLENESISVRMTGCPNGCSRSYLADVGIVGRTLDLATHQGKFAIFLGGDWLGRRLNALYRDLVPLDQVVPALLPLLSFFCQARRAGESFGDFCARQGVDRLEQFAKTNGADAPTKLPEVLLGKNQSDPPWEHES